MCSNSDHPVPGDKVVIRRGLHRGLRGIVQGVDGDAVFVCSPAAIVVRVACAEVQNFSGAARKAWQTRPKRAVGRRKLAQRKRMVSLRIDEDIWTTLALAAEMGLIENREAAVNAWLREKVTDLMAQAGKPNHPHRTDLSHQSRERESHG